MIRFNLSVRSNMSYTNEIKVDFEDIQILGINEKENTIKLKLSLALWWVDLRITILPNATQEEKAYVSDVYLPKEFTSDLWLPDAYIENVHKINKFNFIQDYQTFCYWVIDNQGWLIYKNEVEIDMFCKMTFESYPLDEQTCYFLIGSPTHLEYSGQFFATDKIKFNNSQQVSSQSYEFKINQLPESKRLSLDQEIWSRYGIKYHYQRSGFEIKFQHNFWKYLMNYYIPSGILVIFSWVSEKINEKTTVALR